jgi:hypothetical protein
MAAHDRRRPPPAAVEKIAPPRALVAPLRHLFLLEDG